MTETTAKRPVRPYNGVSANERIAARRERLLDAGLEEFGTRGYVQTGVKDICRAAGLTDRYFYESFKDSAELFVAVFDRVTERLFTIVANAAAVAPQQPEAIARAAITAYVRELAANPHAARVLFVEAAGAGPEVERHMRTTLRNFATLVATTARPHLLTGVSDQIVRLGALSFVGMIERIMIEWQDGELDLSIDEIIDHLVAMFVIVGAAAGVTRLPAA
jgi:AcrR family transcriptional regulator